MIEQLYRLPLSGDWVVASAISSIVIHKPFDKEDWKVIVVCNERHYEISCPNLWIAEETRSEIACEANHAKLALDK